MEKPGTSGTRDKRAGHHSTSPSLQFHNGMLSILPKAILYYERCILNVAGTALEFFSYDSDWMYARIPPNPDISKGLLNMGLSRSHSIVALNQWQTLYSHLTLIMRRLHSKLSDYSND